MDKTENLSALIVKYFSSSAGFHLTQMVDGSYRKTTGRATPTVIRRMLADQRAIACYQKNLDQTINWICFDFDILKSNINTSRYKIAEAHLLRAAKTFTNFLTSFEICHLIEFSGNRGIHVWIHVDKPLLPHAAYSLVKHLIEQSALPIDRTLIAIDLFPSSASNKSLYGKGVKTPLSKHAKSGNYSLLLEQLPETLDELHQSTLDDGVIDKHVEILEKYKPSTTDEIEEKLSFRFSSAIATAPDYHVIRAVNLSVNELSLEEMLDHWSRSALLEPLATDIKKGDLNHERRELVVGLLKFLRGCDGNNIGEKLLKQIFSLQKNYNAERTENGLKKLRFFQFPSQETIEARCGIKGQKTFTLDELAGSVTPHFQSIDQGLFLPHELDLNVTKVAELNYLHQNDEVLCIKVIDDIESSDYDQLNDCLERHLSAAPEHFIYRHFRKEKNKDVERQLITLGADGRLFTTWAVKCLSNFYNYRYSDNSFGYKLNINFREGYIFKPWLYQWIEFLSHIKDVIANPDHSNYIIVKTDIKSFYDSIQQDRLERLLLIGLNTEISETINSLNPHSRQRYTAMITALMQITRACNRDVISRVGVPQGPAYARYLAELYLGPIDELMDSYLTQNELIFYHRYVDDIFFVATSNVDAEDKLHALEERLKILGLSLNREKTTVVRVADFSGEFDKYRAQAKYAVDAISKNFEDATEHQKDVALSEYNKLISTQDDNDDAVFLFSHLTGVEHADRYRDTVAMSIIQNGIGRGNLFKHVFVHLLDRPQLWEQLEKIKELNALQSEVFTSVVISTFISHTEVNQNILELVRKILPKLSRTPLVDEHLIYLRLHFKIGPELNYFSANSILNGVKSAGEPERLHIGSDVLNACTSALNGIEDTGELVSYLYPLCIKANTNATTLDGFSRIFYAKLAQDAKTEKLHVSARHDRLLTPKYAAYFYHLLCLFSLAESNESDELLTNAWKFCVEIHNLHDSSSRAIKENSWYKNLNLVSISKQNLNIVLASISDGALWRGSPDKYGIYTHFHNALVVYLLAEHKQENNADFAEAIANLKEKGIFYKWIFDEAAILFPNRDWFISNARYNDCVLLKRDGQILIRKPAASFVSKTAIADNTTASLAGYADDIVSYAPGSLRSINLYIRHSSSFFERLQRIGAAFQFFCQEEKRFPNYFANSSLMQAESFASFNDDLLEPEYFIFDHGPRVELLKANLTNFVKCLFLIARDDSLSVYVNDQGAMTTWKFFESCIAHFDKESELSSFMRALVLLFKNEPEDCTEASFDLAVASAIYRVYMDIDTLSLVGRIKNFYEKYNRIHRGSLSKHIYKWNPSQRPSNDNLELFLDSFISTLEAGSAYRPDLSLGLVDDINALKEKIEDLLSDIPTEVALSHFSHCECNLSLVTAKIKVNGKIYPYDRVIIVNPSSNLLQVYSNQNEYLLQTSEDAFSYEYEDKVYLYLAQQEFSIAYTDVTGRYEHFCTQTNIATPYPDISEPTYSFDLNLATEVVAHQRDISFSEANMRLRSWLLHIPKSLRQHMVELIEAHECITRAHVDEFRTHFQKLIQERKNPFLMKRISDFNGTHRMLSGNPEVGRELDSFGPNSIGSGETQATLVADICVSGSQTVKGLEYYLASTPQEDHGNYFSQTEEERIAIGERLRNLTLLNLSFVFYTELGKRTIENSLSRLGLKCDIKILTGKDISGSALLGSTNKLSAKAKSTLIGFLRNQELTQDLAKSVFSIDGKARKRFRKKLEECEAQLNLVARYKSMPKKGLDFLFTDLRNQPDSSIFIRVRETNEL